MQTLLLVQHCQSHHHVNSCANLWPDSRNGLTELGQRQAQAVAVRLHSEVAGQTCRLYTSCIRAAETAEIIGSHLGCPPQAVPGLHEFNGRFAMERTEDGPEWVTDNTNWSLFDWRPFPEAETWREFHARVCRAMEDIARQITAQEVPVLVLHGGSISNVVVWWLGLQLDALPERTCFAASPGSLSVLRKNKYGKPVVVGLNDRSHLVCLP